MRKVTRQDLALSAAQRWKDQYFCNGRWVKYQGGPSNEIIHKKLEALGGSATASDVDQIIGNGAWTGVFCDECESRCSEVVIICEDSQEDSISLCKDCLASALALASEWQ